MPRMREIAEHCKDNFTSIFAIHAILIFRDAKNDARAGLPVHARAMLRTALEYRARAHNGASVYFREKDRAA